MKKVDLILLEYIQKTSHCRHLILKQKNYKKKNELTLSFDEETWDKSLEFSDRCVLENVSFFPHPFVDF